MLLILADFFLILILKYLTKFSLDKIFRWKNCLSPTQNFVNFFRHNCFDKVYFLPCALCTPPEDLPATKASIPHLLFVHTCFRRPRAYSYLHPQPYLHYQHLLNPKWKIESRASCRRHWQVLNQRFSIKYLNHVCYLDIDVYKNLDFKTSVEKAFIFIKETYIKRKLQIRRF